MTTLDTVTAPVAAADTAAAAQDAVQVARPADGLASWRAWLALTKPKVVLLLMITALVGMLLASPTLDQLPQMLWALAGITLVCGGAAAMNQVIDQQIDRRMARTQGRPLVVGTISPGPATLFALSLAAVGELLLLLGVNSLTAGLTLVGMLGYAVIYTLFLKRATPQNIVIGGLAGALPPLLGWVAVSGEIHPWPLLLVMIIFTWTPPHFWSLAIHRRDDYASVGIPMLPVTHGIAYTRAAVLQYTVLLSLVCLLPWLTGMSGGLYLAGSLLLNGGFLRHALRLRYRPQPRSAIRTFVYSCWYLLALFLLLLADHWLEAL